MLGICRTGETMTKHKTELGCPVARHDAECCRGCGGRYRKWTCDLMLRAHEMGIPASKMPCGELEEQMYELQERGEDDG